MNTNNQYLLNTQTWLKMFFAWLLLIPYTLSLYLMSYLPKGLIKNWYRQAFQIWSQLWVIALGVKLQLHYKNNHALPERFLLIANHSSIFEDIGIPALFDVDSLAKEGVKHWFILGRIGEAAETLFVSRDSKQSRRQATLDIKAALSAGKSIALYPEGGINNKRLDARFRYGAFKISLKTQTPIVPVFIHYENEDAFYWHKESIVKKLWQIMCSDNRNAHYYVFDAFDPSNYSDKETYCTQVHQQYIDWQQGFLGK